MTWHTRGAARLSEGAFWHFVAAHQMRPHAPRVPGSVNLRGEPAYRVSVGVKRSLGLEKHEVRIGARCRLLCAKRADVCGLPLHEFLVFKCCRYLAWYLAVWSWRSRAARVCVTSRRPRAWSRGPSTSVCVRPWAGDR